MVVENIAFGVLAAASVLAALRMVTTKNVVHAALYLVVVLGSVGAIVVLFLFGVMLTRAKLGHEGELDNDQRGVAVVTALFLLGILGYTLVEQFEDQKLPELEGASRDAVVAARGTGAVGDAIFSTYLVPFEVVSVLLLAALVGAIVLARRD